MASAPLCFLRRHLAVAFFSPVFLASALLYAGEGRGASPRIISLYAAHTEVLVRLGARDNVIGVSKQETYDGPETEGWNPDVYSFRDDVEKFLMAKPDIVLIRPQHAAGGGRMKEALERAGIRVLSLQVTRASELYQYWRDLGTAVGKSPEAEKMIADFEREVRRYRDAAAKRRRRPGVFVEAIHREVKTFTPDSIPAWLVELAGGRNVAADARPVSPGVIIADYGPERLLAKSAEVEIFVSQEGAMNRASVETIRTRDVYRHLKACEDGRVHTMPEAILARPTPSLLRGLELLADWVGPEVGKDD